MKARLAASVMMSVWMCTSAALAEPFGGVVDPVLADKSQQAANFRSAVAAAHDEDSKLEPLPKGLTGEQQRAITIQAYEKAIAIMPRSPWCLQLLERVAYLWLSGAVASERPREALAAYQRLEREYPDAQKFVVIAMCGEASAYETMRDSEHAKEKWRAVLAYQLPDDAPRDFAKMLEEAKNAAFLHLHPVTNGPTTQAATQQQPAK
jgi:tetratricopeptide (TPR) repeat protein